MRNLPRAMIPILRQFELLLSERVWEWAKILLIGAWQAHRHCGAARDGTERRGAVPKLSPRTQPGGLVALRRQPHPAALAGRCLCAIRRTCRARSRRPYRAPTWCKDHGQRHGSRPRALLAFVPCHDQWPALGEYAAAHAYSVGRARVGLALSDRPGAVRALPPGARQAAHAAHRLGAPDDHPSATATARTLAGGRG